MIQHDHPACATFRGGQCTCDEAPLARIEAELERLQTAAMNYAQSPAGFNPTANERFTVMRAQREKVLALVRAALGVPPARGITDMTLPNGAMFDAFGRERVRYVRVTLDGSHLILHPNELEEWKASEPDPAQFTYTDVYLSPEEADALPEFDGF